MLVQYNQISDVVRSTRLCEFFHYIITAIDAVRAGEDESHFLDMVSNTNSSEKRTMITFVNCRSFELGSLDVVIIILGSCIPAREYSLSICDVGSG